MPSNEFKPGNYLQNAADNLPAKKSSVGVLVNIDFIILQFFGRTEKYLQLSPGNASLDILKMAKDGLRAEIRIAVAQAEITGTTYIKEAIATAPEEDLITLEVIPLLNTDDIHFLILFKETFIADHDTVTGSRSKKHLPVDINKAQQKIEKLEKELTNGKIGTQTFIEEHAIALEELVSSNKELQNANEALQRLNQESEVHKKIEAAEERFRMMAAYFKLATESANVGTWSLEIQTQKLEWSPLHKRMWGYDERRQDLVYEDWHRIILPADKEKAFKKVEDARNNHTFYEVEYRIERANDNVTRWMKSIGQYYYNEFGEATTLTGISLDTTEQKVTEEISKYRQALLEAQNEAIPDAILIVNTNGQMLSFNKHFAELWKIPDDIIKRKDDKAALKFAMTQVTNPQGFIDRVNYCYAHPDEKTKDEILFTDGRIIERYGNAVVGEDGTSYGWAWYFRDVTEQKIAEEKILQSEKQLRILANSIPQLTWMADAEGWIYWYNQRWYDYTGTTLEEMQGWGWQSVHHPDLIEDVTKQFKNSIDKGQPYEQTFLLRSKEGEYRWFLTRAIPVRNEEGKIVQWFGTNTDVTDQRNIEEALKESEARFRLLADSMPQQIWTGDTNGNLNYFNEAVYQFSGLTWDDIQKDGWLQIVHPDDREANITKWLHSINTGEDFSIEHRFKNYAGEYRWQLSRAKPKKSSDGKIQLWVGTSTDIHEQKIKEEKKDEFLSIASHEMKTPLTTAKAYLQMLQMQFDESHGQAGLFAKRANDSVDRLNYLISELLDVSKIQHGKLNYNVGLFDFNELINKTVEDLQYTSPNHTIVKTGDIQQQVNGDKDRLQQVVVNLLSNAIKYSPDSKDVYINVEEKDGEVKVAIKDQGIGMNKHHLEKIFDRYYRVEENAKRFQGLGIGLFISYEIIQRHHGKMWAESVPGKGSTFYFTLPLL